ncbi:MAG: hypothetical protein KAI64_06290 [Thermoplasmata archaeon]|nr:hypothetical protein [Thermoplasmata archaeon]
MGALLIFIGVILRILVDPSSVGMIIKLLGAGGGFISSFGGAFLGKEFNKDQRLGLYIVSAAFLLGMVF